MTTQEKLHAVERCIEDFRWARSCPETVEHQTYTALKDIASELRARVDEAPNVAEHEIGRRVLAVTVAKSRHGGNVDGTMMALANEVLARWPVVGEALHRFANLAEVDR